MDRYRHHPPARHRRESTIVYRLAGVGLCAASALGFIAGLNYLAHLFFGGY